MSQGNACASIGNANTTKIPAIGAYVQDAVAPNSDGPYNGCVATTYWNRDAINEGVAAVATNGFTTPANSGAATGKVGRYVTTAAAPMTVSADQTCAVSAAGVVTSGAAQAYKTYLAVGVVVPAGSWMWVFLI
jgi:hypothetical protein